MLKRIGEAVYDTSTREQVAVFMHRTWYKFSINQKASGYVLTCATKAECAQYESLPQHSPVHPLDMLVPRTCPRCGKKVP